MRGRRKPIADQLGSFTVLRPGLFTIALLAIAAVTLNSKP